MTGSRRQNRRLKDVRALPPALSVPDANLREGILASAEQTYRVAINLPAPALSVPVANREGDFSC